VPELLQKGYAPVERSQAQALLKEQEFQPSEVTSVEDAARAGRILNVHAVIFVSIEDYGDEMSMTAKMVGVEDSAILWQGTGHGRMGKGLATIFGAAAGAGADAAGQALAPQQAEQTQKMIKQMCQWLPARVIASR
jgi:hypothetical protein